MSNLLRTRSLTLLVPALAVVVAACAAGAGASAPPQASGGASAPPTAAPSTDASPTSQGGDVIDHATGAGDILLRYEEGGGFIMPGFTASMAPHFTLYGDGTVVFRDPMQEAPPAQGSVFVQNPMRVAKLTEEQIQELLRAALGEGGLAVARPEYRNDMIADASTAFFHVNAAGIDKTVSIYALGLDPGMEGVADAPARAAFAKLAQRLITIDQGGTVKSEVYTPEAYRVSVFESPGVAAPDIRAWPWDDIAVTDFKPDPDPNGVQFPHMRMTAEQLDELQVTDYEGGYQGMVVTGPDGKLYSVAVRPLLPGEER